MSSAKSIRQDVWFINHCDLRGPEHDAAVGEIASAQVAAKAGDGPKAMSHLAKAGKWALDVAKKIGTGLAVAALKASLGI